MKWESHSSTAQQHSMPWNSHRRAACLRKEKWTIQVREPFFLLHSVCVFGCYLVLKTKHKSKINSDICTCYTSLMAFQCKGQNCHPFFRAPNQKSVLFLDQFSCFPPEETCTNSHPLYLLSLSRHHLLPCSHHSFRFRDYHLIYVLRVKSGCPGPPSRPPIAAHCSWNSIYTLAWPWVRADPASASPVFSQHC